MAGLAKSLQQILEALGPDGQQLSGVLAEAMRLGRIASGDLNELARLLTPEAPPRRVRPISPEIPGTFTTRPPRPQQAPAGVPPRPDEVSAEGVFVRTPNSTNVYGFSYDPETSTLYVTYLAPRINPKAVGLDRKTGHLSGTSGSTVKGKNNDPGPKYAYLDVPARLIKQLMQIANGGGGKGGESTPGTWIWSKLRQRGTLWGHKFRYHLVSGAIAPNTGSGGGIYVPRRATPKGFKSRAVAALGTGRRGFVRSTLAAQEGFTTRRPRT